MYCSNIVLLLLHVWFLGCLCGALWRCPVGEFYVGGLEEEVGDLVDGEQFVEDQEFFEDQDPQKFFEVLNKKKESKSKASIVLGYASFKPWSYDLNDVYAMNVKHDY